MDTFWLQVTKALNQLTEKIKGVLSDITVWQREGRLQGWLIQPLTVVMKNLCSFQFISHSNGFTGPKCLIHIWQHHQEEDTAYVLTVPSKEWRALFSKTPLLHPMSLPFPFCWAYPKQRKCDYLWSLGTSEYRQNQGSLKKEERADRFGIVNQQCQLQCSMKGIKPFLTPSLILL